MERKRATDFPQELLDLFDHYVHGEISRRRFLDGAAKYAVGGLTAMAIWESLKPNYALAAKQIAFRPLSILGCAQPDLRAGSASA